MREGHAGYILPNHELDEIEIFIIEKHWPGGRREAIEAHVTENDARYHAGKFITAGEYYIAIQTTKLKGTFVNATK